MRDQRLLRIGVLLTLAALLAVPFLAGCGLSIKTVQPGKLTMGSDTSYPPFESLEGTKPVGFDVELAQAIAKKMGLQLKVISTTWEDIIPGLEAHKYDVIMTAMPINADREKQINFSDPYIDSDQSIAVVKGSPIKNQAGLKGKVVGVQSETTGQVEAEKIQQVGGLKEIRKFSTIPVAFEALQQGKIDAIINDFPVNSYISMHSGKTTVVSKIPTNEKYGIGIAKTNASMLNEVNKALQEVKDDGTYAAIYKKWFGIAPPPSSSAPAK
jgi:ABC-type amino acid transport substrate-binding protein